MLSRGRTRSRYHLKKKENDSEEFHKNGNHLKASPSKMFQIFLNCQDRKINPAGVLSQAICGNVDAYATFPSVRDS
jgi:hypothetical protein